jgi:hypothetical protein
MISVNASNGPAKAADILEAAAKDGKPAGGDL